MPPIIQLVEPRADLAHRLWRLRRRVDHLDASLRQSADGWELTFALNDRRLMTSVFASRVLAEADADTRRMELVRAGWTLHW
jgi:hypothetical protein